MTAARYVRLGMGIVGHTLGGGWGGVAPLTVSNGVSGPRVNLHPPNCKDFENHAELGWGTFQAAQCEPPSLRTELSAELSHRLKVLDRGRGIDLYEFSVEVYFSFSYGPKSIGVGRPGFSSSAECSWLFQLSRVLRTPTVAMRLATLAFAKRHRVTVSPGSCRSHTRQPGVCGSFVQNVGDHNEAPVAWIAWAIGGVLPVVP